MSVESLLFAVLIIRKITLQFMQPQDLHFEARFATGVKYRDSLFEMPLDPAKRADFHAELSLPRQVGVVAVHSGNTHVFDAVLDVTEVQREPQKPSVVALACPGVALMSSAHSAIEKLATYFDCPHITGPTSP